VKGRQNTWTETVNPFVLITRVKGGGSMRSRLAHAGILAENETATHGATGNRNTNMPFNPDTVGGAFEETILF
jgi:hypothetical protein